MHGRSILKVEKAVNDLQKGKMVILVDDENRENEGDLVIAGDFATPDAINFMAKYGRGLICLAMHSSICDRLELLPMVNDNTAQFQTAFTVSIEAKEGVTTGISAKDRSTTIMTAINPECTPEDLARPGHVFPLRAKDGGVLERQGQTEGSVDLMKIAGLSQGAVICEIMNDDGTMSRMPDLEEFAIKHDIKIISIEDIIRYRLAKEILVEETGIAHLPIPQGDFDIHGFRSLQNDMEAVVISKGEIFSSEEPVLLRIHSQCLTGDVFGSKRCDCGDQLQMALDEIAKSSAGMVIYLFQEGRGIGILNKIQAYNLQDHGFDTVEANILLGFEPDLRKYDMAVHILKFLNITKVRLITNNPEKELCLSAADIEVCEKISHGCKISNENKRYINTKIEKMHHTISNA